MIDHPVQLFTRAGPDFSAPAVRETNPELWTRAESALARRHRLARLQAHLGHHDRDDALHRGAVPGGADVLAHRARGVRPDGRQVPAPADDRARRHQLDGRRVGPEPRAAARVALPGLQPQGRGDLGRPRRLPPTRPTLATARSAPGRRTSSTSACGTTPSTTTAATRRRRAGASGAGRRPARSSAASSRRRTSRRSTPASRSSSSARSTATGWAASSCCTPIRSATGCRRRHPWNKQTLPEPGEPEHGAASTRGRRRRAGRVTRWRPAPARGCGSRRSPTSCRTAGSSSRPAAA